MSKLDDVRDKIKRSVKCTDYLTKAKKGGYICPVCHSGEGAHGTGAVKYYESTNTWACHACEQATGRKTGGDVIKLYELTHGVTYKEALKALGQAAGIDVETQMKERSGAKGKEPPASNGSIQIPATKVNIPADYTHYYAECMERLPMAAEYLASRGISMETAETYAVGFDPKADPARSGHACPRLIIPVSSKSRLARNHRLCRWFDSPPPGDFVIPPKGGVWLFHWYLTAS